MGWVEGKYPIPFMRKIGPFYYGEIKRAHEHQFVSAPVSQTYEQ